MIFITRFCISALLAVSLIGCGGGGSNGKKTPPSSTSSSSVSSLSSVAVSSQSSEHSSALAVSSEGVLSSAGSSFSNPGTSSLSSSLSSSEQGSSSSVASSNPFMIEFKPPVIGAQGSVTQKIGQFFIPAAHAASTVRLKLENFALVRINLAGVVQEIAQLPAEAIAENADGSWVINWDGKKSIDWLAVADVEKPLNLKVGDPLIGTRHDLIYAPLTSSYVDVDITSAISYSNLLNWIGGWSYSGATFENELIDVRSEEVVSLFENLLNTSQLSIDEQALPFRSSIEEYRNDISSTINENLIDQVKKASPIAATDLVSRLQNQLNTTNSLIGTWNVCDWKLNSCQESWLIFPQADQYYSIQTTQPDEGCKQGVEVGTYTLNKDTGKFTPQIITDGNDHCGVSDASNTASITVSGTQFSYKENQDSEGVPFVKTWSSNTLVSTWISSDHNKTEILILLNTNAFVFATVNVNTGASDIEQGLFEYENATGNFTITEWKQKSGNDADGFSGAKTIKLNIKDGLLTIITDKDPSSTKAYKRLQ